MTMSQVPEASSLLPSELPSEVGSSALVVALEKSSFTWSVYYYVGFVMSNGTHAQNDIPGKNHTNSNLNASSTD